MVIGKTIVVDDIIGVNALNGTAGLTTGVIFVGNGTTPQ